MKRPIIFLDCDGVLNTYDTWKSDRKLLPLAQWRRSTHLSEDFLVNRLFDFCEEIDAIVVVSSTWRKINSRRQFIELLCAPWLQDRLSRTGAWRTGGSNTGFRGTEVMNWFAKYPRYTGHPYVIFDDDRDFHPGQPFVKVNPDLGLSLDNLSTARIVLARQGWINKRVDIATRAV